MSFDKNLHWIIGNLKAAESLSHDEIFKNCLREKLATTLANYNEQVDLNSDYLLRRSSIKVMKAITKAQKKEDKSLLESKIGENIDNGTSNN